MTTASGQSRRARIIGIHGLANKPPRDEKAAWWGAAIREGLVRNRGLQLAEADVASLHVPGGAAAVVLEVGPGA